MKERGAGAGLSRNVVRATVSSEPTSQSTPKKCSVAVAVTIVILESPGALNSRVGQGRSEL